jgi:hypothetical protein
MFSQSQLAHSVCSTSKKFLLDVVQENGAGQPKEVARDLGVSVPTLYRWLPLLHPDQQNRKRKWQECKKRIQSVNKPRDQMFHRIRYFEARKRTVKAGLICVLSILVATVFCCLPVRADIGVPMLLVVWPASWFSLLLIIPLEALLAQRVLQMDFKRSLKLSAIANLVSSLVGIPVTWIGLVIIQMCFGGGRAFGIDTPLQKIYAVTAQSPWLIPYQDDLSWMVPAAAISLCVPFFLMSIGVEYLAAKVYLRGTVDKKLVLKWSWLANGLSYGCIVVLLLAEICRGTHTIELLPD